MKKAPRGNRLTRGGLSQPASQPRRTCTVILPVGAGTVKTVDMGNHHVTAEGASGARATASLRLTEQASLHDFEEPDGLLERDSRTRRDQRLTGPRRSYPGFLEHPGSPGLPVGMAVGAEFPIAGMARLEHDDIERVFPCHSVTVRVAPP